MIRRTATVPPSLHPDGVPRNDPLPSRTAAVSTRPGMDRTARPQSSTQRCLSTIYCCEQKCEVILSMTDSLRQNQRCNDAQIRICDEVCIAYYRIVVKVTLLASMKCRLFVYRQCTNFRLSHFVSNNRSLTKSTYTDENGDLEE